MAAEQGNTKTLLGARASLKKRPGYLYLTDEPHRLVWMDEQGSVPEIHSYVWDVKALLASKPGSKVPKLKVEINNVPFQLAFEDEGVGTQQRDSFRDKLKELLLQYKTMNEDSGEAGETGEGGDVTAANNPPSPASSDSDEEMPSPMASPPSGPLALSASSGDPVKDALAMTFKLRKKILLSNPELAALHRAVVIKGKLSEDDFWATRHHLVAEAAAMEKQRKGKSSRLIDPKPGLSTSGDMKMTITPQLAQDIFEEWPVLKKAYIENVPKNMSEPEFWKRYFESRLYYNHKASVRSSAAQHVIKEDPIFDRYLEPVDDGLEPRHGRQIAVNKLVDLVATQEDHIDTGNTEDVTMRAGKQKATLPLIRKYNEHSERLLNTALGEMKPVKRARLETQKEREDFDEIDMEDLHGNYDGSGITLDMKNRQRYFEGRAVTGEAVTQVDSKVALSNMKTQLEEWHFGAKKVHPDGKAGAMAIRLISQNIAARSKVKAIRLDVSEDFLVQMKALQAAGNEYLRQFWYLVYPPPEGVERLPVEERARKVGAMRDQLLWVQRRAPELVHRAATSKWDSTGVEEAFKPLLAAIDKALGFIAGRK